MSQKPNTAAKTIAEIENMPAGIEMDYAILKALQWETHFDSDFDSQVRYKRDGALLWNGPFHPSSDIAAAFAAAESLCIDFEVRREECQYSVDLYLVGDAFGHGNGRRAPLAISRAILLAQLGDA